MTDSVSISDGKMISSWQQPENIWQDEPGSIHNDAVATKIGMRGGTIPGTIHLNHFVPIVQALWGDRWFHCGTISMFYTYATTHREDVRAVVKESVGGDDERLDAWVENPDGRIVCKGSVSIGSPAGTDYVQSMAIENAPKSERRILESMEAGMACDEASDIKATVGFGDDEFADVVVAPASIYGLLNAGFPKRTIRKAVGFFGATEVRLLDGPILRDVEYRRTGEIAGVGVSPKTEFAWVDSALFEQESGKKVVEMRHLTRWMKVSSELWKD